MRSKLLSLKYPSDHYYIFQQVANPTQVTDSETNIVFNLVEGTVPEPEDLTQTTNNAASPPTLGQQRQQLQTQILNIKAEAEANTVKAEADGKCTETKAPYLCTCSNILQPINFLW